MSPIVKLLGQIRCVLRVSLNRKTTTQKHLFINPFLHFAARYRSATAENPTCHKIISKYWSTPAAFTLSCTDNMLLDEVVGGVGFRKSYGYSIRGSNDYVYTVLCLSKHLKTAMHSNQKTLNTRYFVSCGPGLARYLLVFTSVRHMLSGYGLSHALVC